MAVAAFVLVAGALLAAGCGSETEQPTPAAGQPATAPGGAAPNGAAPAPPTERRAAAPPDAPIAPMTSRGEPASAGPLAPPPGGGGTTGRLVWDLPDGWTEVPPASPMRMAQATIPGAGGPADLVVFHFGPGGGGGVQANIDRWIAQVEVEGEPERGRFEEGGLRVTWVDAAGTLKPSTMGMGPAEPQPGSRLVGAVVEGPGGPWFFKATGPEQTLAAAREDLFGMLRAARIE